MESKILRESRRLHRPCIDMAGMTNIPTSAMLSLLLAVKITLWLHVIFVIYLFGIRIKNVVKDVLAEMGVTAFRQ